MPNEHLLSNYQWVSDFFDRCAPPVVVKDLYPVYMCICKELYHERYDTISMFFDMIDVSRLDDSVMCSLLHITYNWRNETQGWVPLRDRCAEELSNREINPNIILQGLF